MRKNKQRTENNKEKWGGCNRALPFISFKANARSEGFAKLTKPKPLVFPVRLSRTTCNRLVTFD